jgi:PAS domain S-box-containing protein
MKNFLSFSSLRVRLVLTVFLAVLPPLGMIVYTADEWRRQETVEAETQGLQLARHASAIHLRLIDESEDMLFSLAQLPAVSGGERAGVRDVLVAFLREHPRHRDVGVIEADGKVSLSAAPPGDLIDVADRPFFRRAVATRRFALGDAEIDPITGKGRLVFGYPILGKGGRVTRVLFTVMDLAWVGELAAEALFPPGTTVTVFDSAGHILAQEPDPGEWLGRSASQDPVMRTMLSRDREGSIEGSFLDGVERLLAFKPLPGSDDARRLYVSIGVPAAVAVAPSNRVLTRNLVGLGLSAILAMAMGWMGSHVFLMRRMTALVRTTNRISSGDLSARTGLADGSGEMSELARAVDEMAAVLQEREQEIHRQQEEQAKQERRFRALIEKSSDGIALLDRDGTVRYASPSTTRVLGYTGAELLNRGLLEFIHAEDREQVSAGLAEVGQRPGGFFSASFRVQHKTGSYRWIGGVATNLLDDPTVQAIVANYRDITKRREAEESLRRAHDELEERVQQRTGELLEANRALKTQIADRKRAEEALLESEDRTLLLLNSAAEGIYGVDLNGNCVFCNPASLRLLGFADQRDLLGAHMHEVMHHTRADGTRYPDQECRAYDSFRLGTGTHVDTEVFWRADGTSFPVEYWSYPMRRGGRVVGSVVTFLDITDRKRAEAGLSESRAMMAGILGSAMDAIISVDEEQRILLFNAAAERTFGCSSAEVIGHRVERLIPERLRERHHAGVRAFARSSRSDSGQGRQFSMVGLRLGGDEFPAEATISRSEAAGRPIYTIILRDITERQRSEEAFRKLSSALEQTGDSVFVTNRDGVIEYVNPAFEQLTGYSPKDAIGATPRIHNSGVHDPRFYDRLWKTILSGQVFRAVFTNKTKDGQIYYEDQTIAPVRDGHGQITHFVSTGRDITRRKRTEEALRRLNDQFEHEASRIADFLHDEAGQFLTSAHITLAQVARDLQSPSRERLQTVRNDLDQIEEQLRRLSHELHPRILDDLGLVDALKFLADGVARRAGIPISVEATLENRLPALVETALYRLVQEGLTNMTKHARATRATIVLKQEGQTIHCSIRDDGLGFDVAAALARRGALGLGLLGIQDRLEAVGGTFRIISTPGGGAELCATIPLDDEALAQSDGSVRATSTR